VTFDAVSLNNFLATPKALFASVQSTLTARIHHVLRDGVKPPLTMVKCDTNSDTLRHLAASLWKKRNLLLKKAALLSRGSVWYRVCESGYSPGSPNWRPGLQTWRPPVWAAG
jgi:hypothetical protein